ncbi:MAG: CsgG/HfaB family protein [candidate division KSB1 bacterium]|nr:CsgG/HfaB family protein [candidate division KSB1 bacterium]MDZ7335909.1 CsgG/HfaB family protein [candidate division KSB1 bacterium]MDZ7356026.1 CsgG/HfaB family protein [candidate division KSB1 bacterium]MDZ7376617.1 CsgG/HfaB family protein [candidate division KSB1 bacterium]MDZ7400640.1 CsgG/HfaB family protein [candidate division KSB1 bacterium]
MRFSRNCFITFVLIGFVFVVTLNTTAQTKKRVAVFAFEDKTDHHWHWWTGQPVGEGMADMLTTELVKSGKYQVIERQAIEKIMQEQQLGQTGMITPQSAAKVGQLLGVELAIIGAVTEFGYKKSDVGGVLKKQGFGLGVQSASASVGIDVRFVNTNTGEIIAADNVRKVESKKGLNLDTQKFSFENKNEFDESLVGKATRKAIEEIMAKLDTQLGNLPWQAKVIKVADNMVYINAGSEAGVNVGDILAVITRGEELIDPDTGLSLGAEERQVGLIEVVDNSIGNGKASKCKIKSGGGFQQGDLVRQRPTK